MRTICLPLAIAFADLVLRAQVPTTAVQVDPGPLLCFATTEFGGGEREHVLWVASLQASGPAAEFWRIRDNAAVLRRLDRDHLLVASYGELYALLVVDLTGGSARELAPGAPHEFVGVHGDDVLHLGDPREGARDNFLYATPWRAPGERRRLAEARFERVPIVQGNLAIAVGEGGRTVWTVSLVRDLVHRSAHGFGDQRALRSRHDAEFGVRHGRAKRGRT
ncbi:MAG: hypothetical protein ABIP94_02915, partial [Planctomycetota bacterium]